MRAAVNTFVGVGLALALQTVLGVTPSLAAGDAREAGQEGAARFVPSLHIISGLTVQEWDASVNSEICRECAFPGPGVAPLRSPEDGNDRDVTPYVGAGLEVMTPELPLPLQPRLFLGGEYSAAFGVDRKVARSGEPGIIANPAPAASQGQPFSDDIATGQGTLLTAVIDHFTYGAHAGVAIPFAWRGRQFRIKPSFAWMRWEIELEGIVADAECFQPIFGATRCNPNSLSTPNGFLRPITLAAEEAETFDGIGPGLDLEMDTGRFGPLGTSLFLSARVYRILGDRKVDFEAPTQSFDDPAGNDQARARFSFEVDPWVYRGGVGIRFQWLGFDE